ncbi:MAG TPA: hypothetical protein DCE47_11280, partial [Planctomycetaceae bacterium]|nr:hypothetical protein [Planctomycetaceae bacterium]
MPIREKIAGEPEDGWVTWTIVMQQELTGPVAFVVSWDLKTGDGGGEGDDDEDEQSAASNQVQVQPPVALDLDNDNITGELVIRKDDALEVKWPDDGQLEGLEFIDVRELKLLPTSGSVAFRFHVQPVSLEISTRKFESEKVVQTVVSRALVEMVINKNGTASVRARYRLKSSERQRLRVDLPGESNVSEIFVDQGRVPVEKAGDDQEAPEGWTAYSLNVAGTTTDEEFFLSIR